MKKEIQERTPGVFGLIASVGSVILGLCLQIQVAQAAPPMQPHLTGYYKGDFVDAEGDEEDARLWIQEATGSDGSKTIYGLLLRDDGDGSAQVFRIEDLGDGKSMWMQLFQSQDGLLQFGEDATYDGTLFWKRKVASIRLAVTPFGKSVGCNETVELKSARSRASWADFPIDSKRVGGPGKSEGEIDPSHFNGRVVINNQAYVGSYSLQQLFPGAALMHLVSVSQDAVDGHEVQQEISALVAGLSVHRPILRDTNHFHFVRLDPGASSCLARSSRLKNKIIQ